MKINFSTSNFTSIDGYGNSAIRIIKALEDSGFDIYLWDVKKLELAPDNEAILKSFLKKNFEVCDTILCFDVPTGFKRISPHQRLIGYTMFETTSLPKEYVDSCNLCDLILVPAIQLKQIFKDNGVKVPIEVLPLLVDDKFQYMERPEHSTPFTFLFLGTIDEFDRKGWYELYEAFTEEFDPGEAHLIFKSPFITLDKCMVQQMKSFNHVQILSGVFSQQEIISLFKKIDCFVFPTHGEGFGLTPLEAMSTGLPVIATDWLGCADYMDAKYSYPLPVETLEPAIYAGLPDDVGNWATINTDKLKALMRYVYLNQKEAKDKGKMAAEFVNSHFRAPHFVKQFCEIIDNKNLIPISIPKATINENKVSSDSKIVFLAHHISQSEGYGCMGAELMQEYPMIIEHVRDGLIDSQRISLANVASNNIIIQLCAGDLFKNLKMYKKSVGYTMFETTKLPAHWANNINNTCHDLIVPAEEVKKVFKNSGITIPIQVVPLWVNRIYQYYRRPKREIFKFLWVGKLDNYNRKGWEDAVKAFKQEFKHDRNVKLVIKTAKLGIGINEELLTGNNIEVIEGTYTNQELYEVYKSVDCFLFPTHAEGFGLPPLEAMATGLPTIVTDWMGCKEFAKTKYCYPIKVNSLEIAKYPEVYGDVGQWARININKVRKLMRYVYENQEKAKTKGREASHYVDKYFRIKNFNSNIKIALGFPDPKKTEVSIIITVKDNLEYLRSCVESIYKCTEETFELILVDNDSCQEVKEFIANLKIDKDNVKVITNAENKGYAYGCNQGIKIATKEYICILDMDTIVTPGWLTEMINCFVEKSDCGIVTPSQSALTDMVYQDFQRNEAIDLSVDIANFAKTLKRAYEEKDIFETYGFCHLVKKVVYENIGVYDWKRYQGLALNDTDLFWRAIIKNYKLYWAKGAFVYHFHNKIKESLGFVPFDMVEEGNKVFEERQKYPENYFVKNDAVLEGV